jgi:hypothetical protein
MAKVHVVKKAAKDYPEHGIKKGETYYWWKPNFGSKHFSKTPPKRSQLTSSDFKAQLWDLEDGFRSYFTDVESLESDVENYVSELENLRDTCQESLDNMPEHLQESSPTGEMLQERLSAMEDWIDGIQGVDLDIDEDLSDEEKQERYESILEEIEGCNPGID